MTGRVIVLRATETIRRNNWLYICRVTLVEPQSSTRSILTSTDTVLSCWLDVRTIGLEIRVQTEEVIKRDGVEVGQLGTRVVVDSILSVSVVSTNYLTWLRIIRTRYGGFEIVWRRSRVAGSCGLSSLHGCSRTPCDRLASVGAQGDINKE